MRVVIVECKRIISKTVLWCFLGFVIFVSVCHVKTNVNNENISALISADYEEKTLEELSEDDMGSFVILLNLVITALILPLFGRDSNVQMEELVRSARFGQKRLDFSRILSAYLLATLFYVCSVAIYFIVVMLPLGIDMVNFLAGYVGLVFMVSVALMVTIILKNLLASASLIAIFYVMLIVINQLYVYEINHWFANFMPVRMAQFRHFYTENELYCIMGRSVPCLDWSIAVSLFLSVIFLVIVILVLCKGKDI